MAEILTKAETARLQKEIQEAIADWMLILEIEVEEKHVEGIKQAKAHIAKLKAQKAALKRKKEVPDGNTWEEQFIMALYGT